MTTAPTQMRAIAQFPRARRPVDTRQRPDRRQRLRQDLVLGLVARHHGLRARERDLPPGRTRRRWSTPTRRPRRPAVVVAPPLVVAPFGCCWGGWGYGYGYPGITVTEFQFRRRRRGRGEVLHHGELLPLYETPGRGRLGRLQRPHERRGLRAGVQPRERRADGPDRARRRRAQGDRPHALYAADDAALFPGGAARARRSTSLASSSSTTTSACGSGSRCARGRRGRRARRERATVALRRQERRARAPRPGAPRPSPRSTRSPRPSAASRPRRWRGAAFN